MAERKNDVDMILNSISGFLIWERPLAPLVPDNPNPYLLKSLGSYSAHVQRLDNEFSNAFGTRQPYIISFYETMGSPTSFQTFSRYVREQEFEVESGDVIGIALTLTGSLEDVQALPCAQYLTHIWPSTGQQTLQLMKDIVRSESGEKHELTVSLDASKLTIEARGIGYSLAELGEQPGWLGAALWNPPIVGDLAVAYCRLRILQAEAMESLSYKPDMLGKVHFELRTEPPPMSLPNGQCQLNLFRSPIVVEGYPTLVKSDFRTGLEIPLDFVAELVQARCASIFDGRVFVKGFYAMLVLAKRLGDILIWHLLCSEDKSRIST
ncbi:hypothetical protein QQS21_003594 [Conoideocrella luteorostrata]|uniref:Uncharacterized protein n=1 Tax=Conoideocrella luteorostrata TaxID=1105319 RepID=A0AAJ0CVY6_9HYPO|nr:hypothetical protein QQS21_003594 [Conoideocrella luteorostrata]